MTTVTGYVEATFYAQVEPEFHPYNGDQITAVKVRRTTQARPDNSTGLVVKVVLRVPRSLFPTVVAEVSADESADVVAEVSR